VAKRHQQWHGGMRGGGVKHGGVSWRIENSSISASKKKKKKKSKRRRNISKQQKAYVNSKHSERKNQSINQHQKKEKKRKHGGVTIMAYQWHENQSENSISIAKMAYDGDISGGSRRK